MRTTRARIVAYYRVSTRKQGESGLGLEAQRSAVREYARQNRAKIIAEYTEVETGKRADRPTLEEALGHTKLSGATLVIAKLDRLARNVRFTAELMESGVDFIACDNPNANKLTIQILAAVAEDEARRTSERTTQALEAAKARGVKLGSARPGHWVGREHLRGWAKATKAAADRRARRTKEAYDFLLPTIHRMRDAGETYQRIADWLNERGHLTTAKRPFTPTAVWRVLRRVEKAA